MSRVTASPNGLGLSGEVDLTTLMQYDRELQDYLPFSTELKVDLSELKFRGSAVLALLVMIKRQAYRDGVDVSFVGADERLQDMAALADLTDLIHLGD